MTAKPIFDLAGRVAIVTGGSVGLGRQMAEGLAEMGANLVLCARKKERCLQASEELQKLGVEVLALGCDVKQPASVQEVADAAVKQFGRIDILINNAGTSWGAPVEAMTLEQWNKVIETNLTGTFLFSQAVGRVMITQRRGKIINIPWRNFISEHAGAMLTDKVVAEIVQRESPRCEPLFRFFGGD